MTFRPKADILLSQNQRKGGADGRTNEENVILGKGSGVGNLGCDGPYSVHSLQNHGRHKISGESSKPVTKRSIKRAPKRYASGL